MANETTNSNVLSDIKDDKNFFGNGNVSKLVQTATVGVCLGAPVLYQKEKNTNLTNVCVLFKNQPAIFTFGNEDSFASLPYSAIYHQIGLEKLISNEKSISNEEACKIILDKFQSTFNLGRGNNYSTILETKLTELGENVKNNYPVQYSLYDNFSSVYSSEFKKSFTYGSEAKAEVSADKVEAEESAEKKTNNIVPPATGTQTQARVNA